MTTKTKSTQSGSSSRRSELRQRDAQRRRQQNLLLIAVGVVVVVLIAIVVVVNVRGQAPVSGEQSFASQGNVHIPYGSASSIAYNSTPPTSGPHYGNIAAWNVYDEPQRYEQVVHNMEDGGVLVFYQCEDGCPEIVNQLQEIVEPYLLAGRHVLLMPNDPAWTVGGNQLLHKDMGARIAVTAWQRLLTMDEVDSDKIRAFIERYEGIDHHVSS